MTLIACNELCDIEIAMAMVTNPLGVPHKLSSIVYWNVLDNYLHLKSDLFVHPGNNKFSWLLDDTPDLPLKVFQVPRLRIIPSLAFEKH